MMVLSADFADFTDFFASIASLRANLRHLWIKLFTESNFLAANVIFQLIDDDFFFG